MRGAMCMTGCLQKGKQQSSEVKLGGMICGARGIRKLVAKHGEDCSLRTGVSYVRAAAMNRMYDELEA